MKNLFGCNVNFDGNAKRSFHNYPSKVAQIVIGPWMCKGSFVDMIKLEDPENLKIETLIIHSCMMINLGNGKKWSVSVLQTTLKEASRILDMKPKIKIGVVVHIGKGLGATLEVVIEQIKRLVIPEGITLYLENAAGAGHELGINFDELIELFEDLPKKIKLCIDTQHSFAAGLFMWHGKEEIKDFFEMLELYLPGRLALIHLNDSKVFYNSRVDRHENLFQGKIWGDDNGASNLKNLLDILVEKRIPTILETPDPVDDLTKLLTFYSSSVSTSKTETLS